MKVAINNVCEKTASNPSTPSKILIRKPTHNIDLKILTPKQVFQRLIHKRQYLCKFTK